MADTEFLSPRRKLVAFFKSSRDKWKAKCQQVKYELKLLKRRFENLWQQRYREAETQRDHLQAQREHLRAQNQKLQAQVEMFSKRGAVTS